MEFTHLCKYIFIVLGDYCNPPQYWTLYGTSRANSQNFNLQTILFYSLGIDSQISTTDQKIEEVDKNKENVCNWFYRQNQE